MQKPPESPRLNKVIHKLILHMAIVLSFHHCFSQSELLEDALRDYFQSSTNLPYMQVSVDWKMKGRVQAEMN